jgi:hypothetical protein
VFSRGVGVRGSEVGLSGPSALPLDDGEASGMGGGSLFALSLRLDGVEMIVDAPQLISSSLVSMLAITVGMVCRGLSRFVAFGALGPGGVIGGDLPLILGGRRIGAVASQSESVRLRLEFGVVGAAGGCSLLVVSGMLPSGYPFLAMSPGVARGGRGWGGGVKLVVLSGRGTRLGTGHL